MTSEWSARLEVLIFQVLLHHENESKVSEIQNETAICRRNTKFYWVQVFHCEIVSVRSPNEDTFKMKLFISGFKNKIILIWHSETFGWFSWWIRTLKSELLALQIIRGSFQLPSGTGKTWKKRDFMIRTYHLQKNSLKWYSYNYSKPSTFLCDHIGKWMAQQEKTNFWKNIFSWLSVSARKWITPRRSRQWCYRRSRKRKRFVHVSA
jgi:hypothetical protein